MKKQVVKDLNPMGTSFDEVARLKEKTDTRDQFLIYMCNNGKLNNKASYVFKSSKLKMQMAANMDRSCDHPLSKEYCYIDGKAGRCKGFITLTLSVYHPVLRHLVSLAVMECEGENTESVSMLLQFINKGVPRSFQQRCIQSVRILYR